MYKQIQNIYLKITSPKQNTIVTRLIFTFSLEFLNHFIEGGRKSVSDHIGSIVVTLALGQTEFINGMKRKQQVNNGL